MTNNERMRIMLREGPLSTAELIARFGPARTTLRTLRSLKQQQSIVGDDDLWHIADWAATEYSYQVNMYRRNERLPAQQNRQSTMELARLVNGAILAWR